MSKNLTELRTLLRITLLVPLINQQCKIMGKAIMQTGYTLRIKPNFCGIRIDTTSKAIETFVVD